KKAQIIIVVGINNTTDRTKNNKPEPFSFGYLKMLLIKKNNAVIYITIFIITPVLNNMLPRLIGQKRETAYLINKQRNTKDVNDNKNTFRYFMNSLFYFFIIPPT
ncbi:MAG: hypothetical protein WCK10_04175, partial [Candidatus Staskawiczbacteria bacterium]